MNVIIIDAFNEIQINRVVHKVRFNICLMMISVQK